MWPEIAEKAEMPKMSQSEKSAQQYGLVNKETGDIRTSNDKGSATLVNGEGGKNEMNFTDWKPWAYTAGGGALAYLLAKKLFDDDDDEDGKKKGFIGTILPYLAAVGGGLGGYALSGVGNEAGQNGEVAFKIGPDGKVQMPDKPMKGDALKYLSGGAAATGAAAGARGWASYWHREPARLRLDARKQYREMQNQARKAVAFSRAGDGIAADMARDASAAARIHGDHLSREAAAMASLRSRNTVWNNVRDFLGKKHRGIPRTKGSLWTAIASFLGAPVAYAIGDRMNDKYQAWKAVQKAFGTDKDVND